MLRRSLRTQITTKVVAISAAAALLLGTALVVLIAAVTGQRDAARTAFSSQEALSVANQLETSLLSIESGLNRYVTTEDEAYLGLVNRDLKAYPAITRRLSGLVSSDPRQQARVRAIGEAIRDYDVFWATTLVEIAREDGFANASSQVETDGGRSRIDDIRAQFTELFDRERAVIRAREDSAERLSTRAIGLGIGGLVLVIAVALGFTLYLRRAVLRPVRTVADATGRLAAGDLSTRVPDQREDELGELARGFNSMADSLERGRAELERSNAELTRSNSELEQFASVTSHDLQAPLTTISMYAELLERRRGAGTAAGGGNGGSGELDLVEGIRGATQQARGLIRDLLEYSRAGRGQLALEQVPVDRVVGQALEALAGAIEEAHAEVTVGELPVVLADRANLCRVFQNLIGNAVKFTGDRAPRVRIEAEREGEHWRFSVRDNGIGMNPEHARRIFEPFQRLHGEEDYPGTGIGLAVCERIIDQHGGRIWVSSALGEGSVFHFTLPAATPAAAQSPRVAVSA
ncbi:MAG: ATP-binding protein [Solirubrobacteraceae bacterium]|nr:ATP-binding protein [Solirubrobacteraceae bacterium]